MNELMMRMMMQMFSNASGGQQQNTQQQDTQESLANNLLSSATPALGTVATKLASGEKFNVGDIGSVLQGASPALNMIPGVGTIASAGTNILGSVLQGLGNKQEEFKPGQVLPQVSNPYMCGGKLKSYQFGGPMKQYNAPPHSMGGQAVDANGNPTMNPQQGAAEIEKQEMYSSAGPGDGFVFSDAITLPNGMTLAQKAAEIEKKFGKYTDSISMATKERELKKLAEYGEAMKKQMQEQAAQQQMQASQRMQAGAPTEEQIQQQQMMQQQQGMPQQQMQQGQMPMMPFGGVMQEPPVKTQRAQVNQDIDDYLNKAVLKEDTLLENLIELADPTGVSSWDDAHRAYQSWIGRGKGDMGPLKNFPQTLPTLSEISDLTSAIPIVGTGTKIARIFGKGIDFVSNLNDAYNMANNFMDDSQPNNFYADQKKMFSKRQYGGKLKASNGLVSGGDPPPAPRRSDYSSSDEYKTALETWGMKYPYSYIYDSGFKPIRGTRLDNVYKAYGGSTQAMKDAEAESLKQLAAGTTNNSTTPYAPSYDFFAPNLQQAILTNPVDATSSSPPSSSSSQGASQGSGGNRGTSASGNAATSSPPSAATSSTTTPSAAANKPARWTTTLPAIGAAFNKNQGVDPSQVQAAQLAASQQAAASTVKPAVAPQGRKGVGAAITKTVDDLGGLNTAALALKGAGILGSAIDAFQKPEVVDPRLPNFAAQDQYFSETGIDPQFMLNQANLQKNAAMQAASQGAGSYGQFLNRANAIMRGTQDAQSQSLLSAQQYNDQMSMARGSRGDRNVGITSQMQQQADVLNAQNRAAQAAARDNLMNIMMDTGSTLNQMQYMKDAIKNKNELARMTVKEFAAALGIQNPDFANVFKTLGELTDKELQAFLEQANPAAAGQ